MASSTAAGGASQGPPQELWPSLRAVWGVFRAMVLEGGLTVVTPGDTAGEIAARTVIQPDGDILVQVSSAACARPALWRRHQADIAAAVAPLFGLSARIEALGTSKAWVAVSGVSAVAFPVAGVLTAQGPARLWGVVGLLFAAAVLVTKRVYPRVLLWGIRKVVGRVMSSRGAVI